MYVVTHVDMLEDFQDCDRGNHWNAFYTLADKLAIVDARR